MAKQAKALKKWLAQVEDDALVAIAEDGSQLVVVCEDDFYEVGGVPRALEELRDITLDTRFENYHRYEGPLRECTAALASWVADLDRVRVVPENVEVGMGYSDIRYRLSLAQAFEIGWSWDTEEDPARYLARRVMDWCVCALDYDDDDLTQVARIIRRLWDEWKAAHA